MIPTHADTKPVTLPPDRKGDDRYMVLNPQHWPMRQGLCMKQRNEDGQYVRFGVLVKTVSRDRPKRILLRIRVFNSSEILDYEDVDQLLADGWIVD